MDQAVSPSSFRIAHKITTWREAEIVLYGK